MKAMEQNLCAIIKDCSYLQVAKKLSGIGWNFFAVHVILSAANSVKWSREKFVKWSFEKSELPSSLKVVFFSLPLSDPMAFALSESVNLGLN